MSRTLYGAPVAEAIRAENTAPLSPVYEDSCLEFFFMRAGGKNYFNFENQIYNFFHH